LPGDACSWAEHRRARLTQGRFEADEADHADRDQAGDGQLRGDPLTEFHKPLRAPKAFGYPYSDSQRGVGEMSTHLFVIILDVYFPEREMI